MAQQIPMKVELIDGTTLSFDVDSIERMTFVDGIPKRFLMLLSTSSALPRFQEYKYVDSMIFGMEGLLKVINIYREEDDRPYTFPITGKYPLDSIVFKQFLSDTNIITLLEYWEYVDCFSEEIVTAFPSFAYWATHEQVYASAPLAQFTMNSNFQIVEDTTFCAEPFISEFSTNSNEDRLLFVASRYVNASMGTLNEYVVSSGAVEPLLSNADTNIGFALYLSNDDDSIIYYSYGESISSNQNPPDAGYYLYDRKSHQKALLFHYVSDIGPQEMLNSFDIKSDGSKLLIAAVGNRKPFLIEFDIKSKTVDTLKFNFPDLDGLRALYIQYNHSGSHAVYSMYPFGTRAGEVALTQSSLGIIDLQSNSISELQAKPSTDKSWLSLWPSWSPDDKNILFVAAAISKEPAGALGEYNLCILKIDE